MMIPFTNHQGVVVPLDRVNVDTDLIIPKQFLKSIKRSGFGPNLFDQLRYMDEGQPGMDNSSRPVNKDFVLNMPRYKDGSILLSGDNFGCGSSREHAPWALADYGFRVIIAPSFADIFYNNCFKNGLLPLVLPAGVVKELFQAVKGSLGYQLEIKLESQKVVCPDGRELTFEIDRFRKECLLQGLDDIGLTLKEAENIRAFEAKRKKVYPWMFTAE